MSRRSFNDIYPNSDSGNGTLVDQIGILEVFDIKAANHSSTHIYVNAINGIPC